MRDDKTGTDEELNTPDTARTIPTRRREEPRASGDGRVASTRIAEPLGARVRRRQPAGRTVHGKQRKNRNNSPTCSQTLIRLGSSKRSNGRRPRRKPCDEHERKRT